MASDSSTKNPGAFLDPDDLPEEQVAMAESAAQAVAEADEEDEAEDTQTGTSARFILFNAVPSWLVSMIVHMVVLLVLALMTMAPDTAKLATVLSVANASESEEIEEFEMVEEMVPLDVQQLSSEPVMQVEAQVPTEVTEVGVSTDIDAAPVSVELADFSNRTAPRSDLMKQIGVMGGSGLDGRGSQMRGKMVRENGGSEGSEQAVAMSLAWLAEHQLPDGSWSFDHRGGRCQGRCSQAGTLKSCYSGGTAMALLPFLGAGQTHNDGQYKANVGAGLAYLVRAMKPNGSLVQGGGNMYAHGLAAITLCEAYAMTNDRKLMAPAQASLNFISFAQDPVGGGWRYSPRQPGDTSVVGWQLMALKSGHMAYLQVPSNTVLGSMKFLNSVQADGGAKYGYTSPGTKPSTSAVGLLCRMYLGWKKDHPGLQKGAQFLSELGPSKTDMYYNYYATQVMRHMGDKMWDKWNSVIRDQLVNSQSKNGHMKGSWDVPSGGHANERGGRLYVTSMATMMLEVYYRHMPIYGKAAAEEDFPL